MRLTGSIYMKALAVKAEHQHLWKKWFKMKEVPPTCEQFLILWDNIWPSSVNILRGFKTSLAQDELLFLH